MKILKFTLAITIDEEVQIKRFMLCLVMNRKGMSTLTSKMVLPNVLTSNLKAFLTK